MQSLSKLLVLSSALFLIASGCSSFSNHSHQASNQAAQLNAAIQKYSDATKRLDAFEAPYFNVEEDLGKFGDYPAPEFFDRSKQIIQTALNDIQSINPSNLTASEQITYRLFKEDMEVSLKGFDFPTRYLDLNQMGNRLHDYMDTSSQALTSFPFDTAKHYRDYLERSKGFPQYVDRQIALLREGIQKNIVLSCTVASKVPNTYQDALIKNVQKNAFYRPIDFMPKEISDTDRKAITAAFSSMIKNTIIPNYAKFDHFYRTEYVKHCRKGFGLVGLPNADDWYKYEIKSNTNLDLTPEVIHQKGLSEVARISKELEKIKDQEGYKGSLRNYMRAKSNDPKNYFANAADMFAAFEKVKAEVALKVPAYFSLVPKSDFKIVETSNPEDASGSYNQPTETAPFGRFMVNTHNVRSVPIFDVTTLLMHETVPGHHFQLALQYEMKDLSDYQRKIYQSNAFVEGWALYAEYLGNEMGMYTDTNQHFGHLNDEMLRAVRLVVDTGIHSMGWSQKKAIAYAREYLASDPKDIQIEINRYSVWPGQALGYKIGQLKILELRHQAEKMLGSKFDIKGFHKAVIGSGTVSLGVMETLVNNWM
jgi:uncharacterized protein (DUF885 family)